MSNLRGPDGRPNQARIYQIRVQGHLGRQWADWFEGLEITPEENGISLLAGAVVDQAALHGILRRIRDLGIELISVNAITSSLNDQP